MGIIWDMCLTSPQPHRSPRNAATARAPYSVEAADGASFVYLGAVLLSTRLTFTHIVVTSVSVMSISRSISHPLSMSHLSHDERM